MNAATSRTRRTRRTQRTHLALQRFEPEPGALYSLEVVGRLARVPRHTILVCCRRGLVAPVTDAGPGTLHFGAEAIRTLRLVDRLRTGHGINWEGIEIIVALTREVRRLRPA